MVTILVMGRIFASSWAKVLQKKLAHNRLEALLIATAMFGLLALMMVPALLVVPLVGLSMSFWLSVGLAVLLDVPGNAVLVKAVGMTDLSLQGPLNAYKPIVGLILGMVTLGEIPSMYGLLGVLIIFLGSSFLAPSGEKVGFRALVTLFKDHGVQLSLFSLVMTAGAAVMLKAALETGTSMQTFMAWTFLSTPLALGLFVLWGKAGLGLGGRQVRTHFMQLLSLAVMFMTMQLMTIKLLEIMYVAYALSLFQLSAVVNVFFGHTVFKEQNILQRALGSLIMIVGAVMLIMAG